MLLWIIYITLLYIKDSYSWPLGFFYSWHIFLNGIQDMTHLRMSFCNWDLVTSKFYFMWCVRCSCPSPNRSFLKQSPMEPSCVGWASMKHFSLQVTSVKRLEGASSATFYPVRTQILLFTVRVAVIRAVSGGPRQGPLLFPEITGGNVLGNLKRMESRTESCMSDCNSFYLLRPYVTELKKLSL